MKIQLATLLLVLVAIDARRAPPASSAAPTRKTFVHYPYGFGLHESFEAATAEEHKDEKKVKEVKNVKKDLQVEKPVAFLDKRHQRLESVEAAMNGLE